MSKKFQKYDIFIKTEKIMFFRLNFFENICLAKKKAILLVLPFDQSSPVHPISESRGGVVWALQSQDGNPCVLYRMLDTDSSV